MLEQTSAQNSETNSLDDPDGNTDAGCVLNGADGFSERLARSLASTYPGAALFVNAGGELVVANRAARGLVEYMESPESEDMRAGIASRLLTGGAGNIRVNYKVSDGERTLELTLTHINAEPPEAGGGVLVLGRDITGERSVINALVSSRQLYRDLVECSADFGWETDVNGVFTYVSPQGGFGYSARELNGNPSAMLLEDIQTGNAFNVRYRYRNVEVWLKRKDNTRACVVVSAVPIHDTRGKWIGMRGMCRDVTAVKIHLLQDDILSRIIDAIRSCVDPNDALATAAHHIVEVFASARSLVAKKTAKGFELAAHHGFDAAGADRALAKFSAVLDDATPDQKRSLIEYSDSISHVLAAPSHHHDVVNGVVLIERPVSEGGWNDQERHLLHGIADQFGVAIEQVNSYKALEDLTRVDELTGLLNRRAFLPMVENRIVHQRRTGRPAALLYLDIDNFKMVNDLSGHQEGDRVLRHMGEIIRIKSRAGDMAARIGGDEFLIWLEETAVEGAIAKAKSLIHEVENLSISSPDTGVQLGLSIGISVSDPAEQISLDALIQRADAAMYDAKRDGKTGFAVFSEGGEAKAC